MTSTCTRRVCRPRRGFTIVELLVVVAIIGILVAMLFPAVNAAREAGRRSKCINNLRQLAQGILSYEEKWQVFPPGEIHGRAAYSDCPHCDWDGAIGMWMNVIFPHIDLLPAYEQLDFKTGATNRQYDSPGNVAIMQTDFPLFRCPSNSFYRGLTTPWGAGGDSSRAASVNYFAVYGSDETRTLPHLDRTFCTATSGSIGSAQAPEQPFHCNRYDGMFYNDSAVKSVNIRDGQSNTAMLCEVWGRMWEGHQPPSAGESLYGCKDYEASRGMNLHAAVFFDWPPNNFLGDLVKPCNFTPWRASSFHSAGVHVAYADGSVHLLSIYTDLATFQALATIDGREPVVAPSD